jgi:cobaltochelatase CobS
MNANAAILDRQAKVYDVASLTGIDTGDKKPVINGYDRLPPDAPMYELNPHHEFEKHVVKAILYGLANRRRNKFVQFVGPTRCGKTSTLRELFGRANIPAVFIQCDPDMEVSDLLCSWVLTEKGMVKAYEALVLAMKNGWAAVLEERDSLKPGCNQALHGLMDSGQVLLRQFGGEIVKGHPDFAMFATANTNGNGDEQGIYPAALVQAASSNMRWLNVSVDYMAADKEEAMLLRRFLPMFKDAKEKKATTALVKGLVTFANETRKAVKGGRMLVPCSTGTLVQTLDVWTTFGDVRTAIEMAYLNGIGSADRAVSEEAYKNQIGLFSSSPSPGPSATGPAGNGG